MAKFSQESVQAQLEALGIPIQGELEEIAERLDGYVTYLEELRQLPLTGVRPMDTPPLPEIPHD